jgi:cbb3-type cytochrome oxidase subunit 1
LRHETLKETSMSNCLLRLAVVYFVLGVVLGNVMGATNDFTLMGLHAHLNLLGWVSLGLVGLIYKALPAASETKLAKAHFWLHNLALPVQMVALTFYLTGTKAAGPVLGISSMVVGLAVVCLAINLWRHTGASAQH